MSVKLEMTAMRPAAACHDWRPLTAVVLQAFCIDLFQPSAADAALSAAARCDHLSTLHPLAHLNHFSLLQYIDDVGTLHLQHRMLSVEMAASHLPSTIDGQ